MPQLAPRNYYMYTYGGEKYWPTAPLADEVNIETVAHHLAMKCRWAGATKSFYSVAEHAFYASFLVPRRYALEALHHDSSEAYNGDLIRPLKYSPAFREPFQKVELLNEKAIADAFGLAFDHECGAWPVHVKAADEMICSAEAIQLINRDPKLEWESGKLHDDSRIAPITVRCLDWELAKAVFLSRHRELMETRELDLTRTDMTVHLTGINEVIGTHIEVMRDMLYPKGNVHTLVNRSVSQELLEGEIARLRRREQELLEANCRLTERARKAESASALVSA